MKSLWEHFKRSPSIIQLAISTVVSMWIITVTVIVAGCAILLERPVDAGSPTPPISTPAIGLNPTTGPLNTSVTVYGQGWAANSNILLYLEAPDEIGSGGYASSGAVADTAGQFRATLVIPADARWETPGLIRVVARSAEGGADAQAFFGLISNPELRLIPPTIFLL